VSKKTPYVDIDYAWGAQVNTTLNPNGVNGVNDTAVTPVFLLEPNMTRAIELVLTPDCSNVTASGCNSSDYTWDNIGTVNQWIFNNVPIVPANTTINSTNSTNSSKSELVNSVIDTWGKITEAFKTSIKTEIVKEVTDNGFSKFESSGSTLIKYGLPSSYYDRYVASVARMISVPDDKVEEFKMTLDYGMMGDSSAWNSHELMFNVDSDSNSCKYVTLLINTDTEDPTKINIIVS